MAPKKGTVCTERYSLRVSWQLTGSSGCFLILMNRQKVYTRSQKHCKIDCADINVKIDFTGKITCVYPIEGGKAKVSNACTKHINGGHSHWKSDEVLH